MIEFDEEAKRTIFVDKNNKTYTRIEEKDGTSFVEIYKEPKDFLKATQNYPFDNETIQFLSKRPKIVDLDSFKFALQTILDMHIELLTLQESAAVLTEKNPDPEFGNLTKQFLNRCQSVTENLTNFWAKVAEAQPDLAYNFRPSLFEIPGVTKRILDGEETFKDAYGTIETSNHKAYQDLLIRDMMGGKTTFTSAQLTRVRNYGLDKNNRLKKEYQSSEKKL